MAVTISGTTGVGVSTTPLYPSDILIGSIGTTAGSQIVGARLTGNSGNADILDISNVRGTAGTDWQTAGWRIQQKIDATWKAYIQFNGTASGINNSGISFGTGDSTVSANSVTERMRIDASGNVGIGTMGTSLTNKLTTLGDSGIAMYNTGGTNISNIDFLSAQVLRIRSYHASGAAITFATNPSGGANTERMRIDASGRVTMPAQPAFLANHSLSTATAPSEIVWGNVVINAGSCYSNTTGRFTAPVAGTYFFRAHTLTANATAGESRLALYKNGASYGGAQNILVKAATTWQTIMVQSHMYLAAGDYVSVFIVQVAGSLYNDGNYNSFSGHLIG